MASAVPVEATAVGSGVVEVSRLGPNSCVRKVDGTVGCWGDNQYGQLGTGTVASDPVAQPVQVNALGSAVAQVAVGLSHACARKTDGRVWCWGDNSLGQVGSGALPPVFDPFSDASSIPGYESLPPTEVVGLGPVQGIAAGGNHTCAWKADGTICCWGSSGNGQLGIGTVQPGPEGCGYSYNGTQPRPCTPTPVKSAITCPCLCTPVCSCSRSARSLWDAFPPLRSLGPRQRLGRRPVDIERKPHQVCRMNPRQ